MSASTEEEKWNFVSYCNSALEAAQLGRHAEVGYFLKQAYECARSLGVDAYRERLFAVIAEIRAMGAHND